MFNIVYADREGNIYYLWNGTVPDMPHAAHRSEAVHASGSSDVWTRIHPTKDLPQLLNPEGGYVQNSNSAPYLTNLNEPMDRASFPDHFPANNLSLRTQHSLELIHNTKQWNLEEVVEMKHSMRMVLADRVKDSLISAVLKSRPDEKVRTAINLIERWDNSVSAESQGSVLFEIWWNRYRSGADSAYRRAWTAERPISTPYGLGDFEHAAESFVWAIDETERRYGSWDISWGDVHRIRMGDVDLPASGGGGGLGAFRVASFRRDDADGKLVVSGGDSWVFVVEFADTPKAYTIIGYSESEVEGSPHFSDQAELYSNNTMKPAAFTEEEIEEQLIRRYRPGE